MTHFAYYANLIYVILRRHFYAHVLLRNEEKPLISVHCTSERFYRNLTRHFKINDRIGEYYESP